MDSLPQPCASGDAMRYMTLSPPADSPAMVTFEASPPNAPQLGVYKSTNGGQSFSLLGDLAFRTPPDPTPPETGGDFFAGGISSVKLDPNDHTNVYVSLFGYGIWRSKDAGTTWTQVFHTMNQNDFGNPDNPGDSSGDITPFSMNTRGHIARISLTSFQLTDGDSDCEMGEPVIFCRAPSG